MLITNLLSSIFLVPLLLIDYDNDVVDVDGKSLLTDGTELRESIINVTSKVNLSDTILSENILIEKTEISDRKLLYEKDESLIINKGNDSEEYEIYQYFANVTQLNGNFLCYLAQCSTSLVCTTSIFSILLIGIDQYFAVIHSLRYHSYMNKFRSLLLISTTWILSVFFAFVGVLTQNDSKFWNFCSYTTSCLSDQQERMRTMRNVYSIIYVTLVILLPFIAICSIYVCIYRAARRNSERMRQSTSTAVIDSLQLNMKNKQQLPKVRSAPNFVTFQTENETGFSHEETAIFLEKRLKTSQNRNIDFADDIVTFQNEQIPLEDAIIYKVPSLKRLQLTDYTNNTKLLKDSCCSIKSNEDCNNLSKIDVLIATTKLYKTSGGSCRRKEDDGTNCNVHKELCRVRSVPISKREFVRSVQNSCCFNESCCHTDPCSTTDRLEDLRKCRRENEEGKCCKSFNEKPTSTILVHEDDDDDDDVPVDIVEAVIQPKVTRTCSERSNINFINNIRCKISNASIFKYREESRAAKISILVIFMVLICYVPYGTSLVFHSYTTRTFHYLSMILLITSNVISPFLFAYRNRRIQRELYKFFGIKSNKLSHMNSSKNYCRTSLLKKRIENMNNSKQLEEDKIIEPFIKQENENIPRVIVTCKIDGEKKSILKRVCSANWQNYKKCNFITVPDSCVNGEARGSFSSASTQISNDE